MRRCSSKCQGFPFRATINNATLVRLFLYPSAVGRWHVTKRTGRAVEIITSRSRPVQILQTRFPVRSVKISIFHSFPVPQRRRERFPFLPVLFIIGWGDVIPVLSRPNVKHFPVQYKYLFLVSVPFASHTTSARTIPIPLTGHVIPVSRPVLISRSSRAVPSCPVPFEHLENISRLP